MEKHELVLISGGIGDFLKCVPAIQANPDPAVRYVVITHFLGATAFFKGLGIPIEKFYFFTDMPSQRLAVQALQTDYPGQTYNHCPRCNYFDKAPLKAAKVKFSDTQKPIVGLHLGGSQFSVETQKSFGLVTKDLPVDLLHALNTGEFNLLLFGTQSELDTLGVAPSATLRWVCEPEIVESLRYVTQCELFIGSDSAFKTMSSMQAIPTLVWLGDYIDPPRDEVFIDPYVNDQIMEVFRYRTKDSETIAAGIQESVLFIQKRITRMTMKNTVFATDFGPMIINLNDRGVSGDIIRAGFFEKAQVAFLSEIIKFLISKLGKITVYDVGANLGTHTVAFAKVDPSHVTVRSFEAQRQVFYMLCGNVAINSLSNVYCHHLAVGDQSGTSINVMMPNYANYQNIGGFELEPISNSDNGDMVKSHMERIPCETLDHFDEDVAFIKLDIEGMEEKALSGATLLFERCSPICFVEIFKSDKEKIFKFFQERDYIGYVTHQDLLAIPKSAGIEINDLQQVF